ncbi:capsid protein [Chifec virus UA13_1887]|uniref:Capsid protein n=1 Tax=Chifec virus UA13_1887 TaxID=2914459 RepID=A0AAX3A744_9CIRC|nr:capsid protein [Chifec virus UA13_1887]UNY50605.1 capsid protein [Chifec virus UA13_1887]
MVLRMIRRRRVFPRRRYRRYVSKIRRPYRRRYRRRSKSNLICNFKMRQTVNLIEDKATNIGIQLKLSDVEEFAGFEKFLKAYKFLSCRVKICPQFNVGQIGGPLSEYYSAPWKKPLFGVSLATDILAVDKSRIHPGASVSTRSFVPAILDSTEVSAPQLTHYASTKFKPRIELRNVGSKDVIHYCGWYGFPPGKGMIYNIYVTGKIQFINQCINRLQ